MVRSAMRAAALDENDSFQFAQLTIDGYSGGDLDEGFQTGLILTSGSSAGLGSTTIEMHADDGEINQIGVGQVTFSGDVLAKLDVIIQGDLTVQGTRTELNVSQLTVEDPIEILNVTGTEALTEWSGISSRDGDGYNRMGFVFDSALTDGYWALSPGPSVTNADLVPTRALAYIGEGDAYGDLSSTIDSNSGADKVAITTIAGLTATSVQAALEELNFTGGAITGTTNIDFTVNQDAVAGIDEDPCLVFKGGDGTSLLEGYLCMITDSVAGDRFEFKMFEGGAHNTRDLHLGPLGDTSDVDACVTLNSGDGVSASSASICLDGSEDRVEYSGPSHFFDGYVSMDDNLTVGGQFDAYGDVILGSGPEDCIIFNGRICSDIIPKVDDAYQLGSTTNQFEDGYFVDLHVTNLFLDDITIDGDTILGDSSDDCVIFNASVCSDILPKVADAYQLGDSTFTWQDAYFSFFTPVNYTPVGDTDSLEGHLKGIDDALAGGAGGFERGVYVTTVAEAGADTVDSARAIDQGDQTDLTSLTDAEFRDDVFIYLDGQLLVNDGAKAASNGAVVNDIARDTADASLLRFSRSIKKESALQIVIMTA